MIFMPKDNVLIFLFKTQIKESLYLFPLQLDNTKIFLCTINDFSVRLLERLKMKSILLVLFATSLAFNIKEYEPKDAIVSIIEGETMKLSCLPDLEWYTCEFIHESNGKSCKTKWNNGAHQCKNGKNGVGKMYRNDDDACVIEVNDLKKEDTGRWTCNMSDTNSESYSWVPFNVRVQDNPLNNDTKTVSTATRALPTLMSVSILAITFLIVHI